jgi:cytochrome o ubiquinol oxidase subunit 2
MLKKIYYNLFKAGGLFLTAFFLTGCGMVVLQPKGPIARAEAFIIYIAFALMLVIVVSVFVLAFWFSVRYRASNKKAAYKPNWATSLKIELVIWLVPAIIVLFLSYLAWTSTYQLDPYKPINSAVKPLQIEVVSLDWNWLFIYPDYSIATVNELVLPVDTPLNFRLTSATVMTSFFVPQLGSQIYAMAGMQTRLHLMADETGIFDGHNQEFSGKGYVRMHFKAIVKTPEQFEVWAQKARQSPVTLSLAEYKALSKPHVNHPVTIYSSVVPGLFDTIVRQFTGWRGKQAR